MNSPTNTEIDACLARLDEMYREDEALIARYKALPLPVRHEVTGHHLLKVLLWVGVVLALLVAWALR